MSVRKRSDSMDIFASKLLHVLSLAGIAAVVMSGCGAVIVVIRLSRRPTSDPALNRGAAIWISVVLPLLLLLGGTMLLLYSSAWHRFNSIMAQKPNRMVISSQGKTNEINDPVVIAEFFQIVTDSKHVAAHHSHTVSDLKLLLPQTGYIYSLGRDSQYSNEFWFGWNGVSGQRRDRLSIGASLGQLRSDELADWVQKHSP